ncbi:MAG: type II toxin-antitoxin system HicA family toxin [Candidatus Weimeria sp.]
MKPHDIAIKELEAAGYEFARHGANHDQFRNPKLRKTIPLKRHDFDEDDLRYIRKEIKRNQSNS